MGRTRDSRWRPKDIILLPNRFHEGVSYPNKEIQDGLQSEGYGRCSGLLEDGLDPSWTMEQLWTKVSERYPRHKDELEVTGIEFARIKRGSKKISVHKLEDTVSDLKKLHGQGILVILQKPSIASPKKFRSQHEQAEIQIELDTLAKSGGMNVAHLNCNSLRKKTTELGHILGEANIDVMTLSETKLKQRHSNDTLCIPGYRIIARRDGAQKLFSITARGGVAIYIKDSLARSARECPVKLAEGLEAVCIDIEQGGQGTVAESDSCKKRTVLRIVDVYISGSAGTRAKTKYLKSLQTSLDQLKATDKCKPTSCTCTTNYIILGDFNCDRQTLANSKVLKSTKGELVQTLDELERSHNLKQLITDYTRVRERKWKITSKKTKTLIDLVYTDLDSVLASGVVHITISDHFMVYCALRHCDAGEEGSL